MDAPPSTRSPPSAPPGAPMLARRYAPAPTERALYTRRYGVPLVRRVLSRAALLRAVREERVARVLYFPAADRERLSGPSGECLVEFLDGSLARAFLPPQDTRLLYAMESHGVVGEALAPELAAASARGSEEHQAALAAAQAFVLRNGAYYAGYGLSVVLLAALYLGVRWQLHRRGDAQERADLRAGARAEREEREKRADADAALDVVQALWERGMGAAEIWCAAGERGLGLQRDEVDREVALLELERKDGRETEVGEAEEGSREAAFRGESKLPSNSDRPSKDSSAPDRPSEDPAALLEALSQKRRARAMKEAAAERAAQEAPEGSELLRMPSRALRAARDPLRQRRIRRAQRELQGVRLQYGDAEAVFFDDVAGLAPVLDEVQEVVDFFRKPHRYAHSGARVPRGVLLEGPPGTGKTLLARAVAGEAGVAFLSVNASEFVEMFVGVGAARVRDIFATARELAPAIVFVDELDSVGRVRGGQQGNDERDQTLNQLLTEMDGFATDARVVVLAATNRRDVLDPALVRAGRFDRLVHVGLPDHAGRLELFCCALRAHPHADPESLDLARLARATGGASGAVIAGLVNEAALGAAARGAQRVEKEDLVEALFRLQGGGACASGLGGPVPDAEEDAGVPVADERVVRVEEGGLDAEEGAKPFEDGSGQPSPPSKPPREETAASRPSSFPSTLPSTPQPRAWGERVTRRLALVEAATALAITLLPALEMVESVTVRPRPRWPQGFTAVAPNEQRSALQLFTARYLREQMVGLLAPRAAEQLRLPPDEHSTLVAGRLASARAVARKMVLSDALAAAESPSLGPRALTVAAQVGARQTVQFLPRTVPTEVLEEADALMERLLQAAQRQARELLQRNAHALDALVQALVEQHTLSGDAVRLIVEEHGHPDDLERRRRDAAEFL